MVVEGALNMRSEFVWFWFSHIIPFAPLSQDSPQLYAISLLTSVANHNLILHKFTNTNCTKKEMKSKQYMSTACLYQLHNSLISSPAHKTETQAYIPSACLRSYTKCFVSPQCRRKHNDVVRSMASSQTIKYDVFSRSELYMN
jgi:hypothetical protein